MKSTNALQLAVKAYYDYEDMRIRMGNRMKIKRDGSNQVVPEAQQEGWAMTERDRTVFDAVYKNAETQERILMKYIKDKLKEYLIWTEWLKGIKGVGPLMGAVIITSYDIEKATTPSKMHQFTGLNPGMVHGRKAVKKKNGEIEVVVTDELVRGDRLTPGYLSPFNKWLRTKMCGVLATSFLRGKSPYAKFYYDEKNRLQNSDNICQTTGKPWKEEKPIHWHRAAIRKMMKIFLQDLYDAWRRLLGLPVREPYAEEYLGKKHHAA